MAKGLFGGLKGVDAFGKVWMSMKSRAEASHIPVDLFLDNGGRQGQDTNWSVL